MKLEDKLKSSWHKYLNENRGTVPGSDKVVPNDMGPRQPPAAGAKVGPIGHLQNAYDRLYALWQGMSNARDPAQNEIAKTMIEPINSVVAAHRLLMPTKK
jgi:hypothetical protein